MDEKDERKTDGEMAQKSDDKTSEQKVAADKEVADSEQRLGVKDAATNADAIAAMPKEPVAEKEVVPSFFVMPTDRHRIEVDILANKTTGQVLSVSRTGLGVDFSSFQYLAHTVEWFEFSPPSYEDMTNYRQRASIFRKEMQQVVVDRLQLRNFLIVWHLKDWSLRDKDGNKVTLEFDKDGSLTDASTRKVYSVQPIIIDVVLTILEKDVLLAT